MSSLQRRLERCRPSAISFWAPLPMTRVTLAMPVRAVIWRCFRHSRSVIQGTQQGRSRCPSGASPGASPGTICSTVCSAVPSVLQAPCQAHSRRSSDAVFRHSRSVISGAVFRRSRNAISSIVFRRSRRHASAVLQGF